MGEFLVYLNKKKMISHLFYRFLSYFEKLFGFLLGENGRFWSDPDRGV
jgi:hypothetical protein